MPLLLFILLMNDVLQIKVEEDLCFINVGEDPVPPRRSWDNMHRRNWSACVKYGFLSAGQNTGSSKQIRRLQKDDIVAAFIGGHGYVGIGLVAAEAIPAADFRFEGKLLSDYPDINPHLFDNSNNEKCEYAVAIHWLRTVPKESAHWKKSAGLFANLPVRVSLLEGQQKTLDFLQEMFSVKFNMII